MKEIFNINRFENEVVSLEKNNLKKSIDVLLYGSSTFVYWGQKDSSIALAPLSVLNHGFGGSTADEALYYFDRLVIPFTFKTIVLYEGDNDLAMNYSVKEIVNRMKKLIAKIKTHQPNAKIVILAVKYSPYRKQLLSTQKALNQSFEKLSLTEKNLFYLSQEEYILKKDGQIDETLFIDDKLHFSNKGNLLLGQKMKVFLSSIM